MGGSVSQKIQQSKIWLVNLCYNGQFFLEIPVDLLPKEQKAATRYDKGSYKKLFTLPWFSSTVPPQSRHISSTGAPRSGLVVFPTPAV